MKVHINHGWDVSLKQARLLQEKLSKKICLKSAFHSINEIKSVGACDVAYFDRKLAAAVVIMNFPALEVIEKLTISHITDKLFPYIPEYLSFREGPVLVELLQKLKFQPDLIIFDGQGIAHPRKMGLATHIGILFNIPTIGCAKNLLYGEYKELSERRGEKTYIKNSKNEIVGVVLRTKDFVKPVFVSIGNKISLSLAVEVILRCCKKYRLPEPLRVAHNLCTINSTKAKTQ